jgi:phospholipase C
MISNSAGRRARRRDAIAVSAVALLGVASVTPVYGADPDTATDQLKTATPIKHVIIIVGENRSFEHISRPISRRARTRGC